MRRVAVTGMGIVSPIGNSTQEVVASLREAKSGITASPEHAEHGFKSRVQGKPVIDLDASIDRRAKRFMGDTAAYAFLSMEQAIRDSGLEEKDIVNPRTGLIVGSGGPSVRNIVQAVDITRENKSPKRIGPFAVPKAMSSTCSAVLSTWYKIKGVNYSISSACATSAHCVGNAAEMIQWGKQDIMFAGGAEELDWTLSCLFDAMGAMSTKYNDTPATASRAFDKNRDGFVIAGGGGVVVLEEWEHAKARGAKIYAELVGYGATSDGHDMVAPSGEGALHATGDGDRERRYRLRQRARHFDAGWRCHRDQGDARSFWRQDASDQFHQIADRPFARRHRRSGSHLFHPADEQRLHRRER
jgi:3-oxoacyl-[acyl-carrier-protein] synthase I